MVLGSKKMHMGALHKTFFEGNKCRLAVGVFLIMCCSLLEAYSAVILQKILDAAANESAFGLKSLIIEVVVFLVSITSIELLSCKIKYSFVKKGICQYKHNAFSQLLNKDISSFHKENADAYISSLTLDITSIENNYLLGIFNRISLCVKLLGSVALMLYYNCFMFIVVVVLLVLPGVVASFMSKNISKLEKAVSYKNENFIGKIRDVLNGFVVIKNFKAEGEVLENLNNENVSLEESKCMRRKVEEHTNIISGTLGSSVQMIMFLLGAYLSIRGYITVGVVLAFVQLLNTLINPIQQLPAMFGNRKAALALIEKLSSYLNRNDEFSDSNSVIEELKQQIALKNVNFIFDGDGKKAVSDVSITFEKGKSYAVVGLSGSGKSTLLNILLGMYNEYEGSVMYDGIELKEISKESLYENVAMLPQNVIIFDGTIKDNITMFKKFPDEKYQRAIELSGLSRLIEQRGDGYLCGVNGKNLSGGEKQKIAIARALLKDYSVLLLDEVTSALDTQNTGMVMNAILNLKGITRIAIIHQMDQSILEKFDEILVMKNGEIIERGSFDILMQQKGMFYSLENTTASQS